MLANLLIGLREGLEASLVVGILVAYLVRSGRRDMLRWVGFGVGLAIAVSLALWALITFTARDLGEHGEEVFAGSLSIVAVGFVTWMVLWMRTAAHSLRSELDDRLAKALVVGPVAVAATAFLAVAREGVETVLFLWSAIRSTGQGLQPATGALIGLVASVLVGYLIYRGALRINLGAFFRWTGGALIVIAAGVLGYGVHELQEAEVLPGEHAIAFDVSATIPPDSVVGTLLRGTVNFLPETSWLHAVIWVGYVTVMGYLFLRPQRRRPIAARVDSEVATEVGAGA